MACKRSNFTRWLHANIVMRSYGHQDLELLSCVGHKKLGETRPLSREHVEGLTPRRGETWYPSRNRECIRGRR
jgi:hypothetical protein